VKEDEKARDLIDIIHLVGGQWWLVLNLFHPEVEKNADLGVATILLLVVHDLEEKKQACQVITFRFRFLFLLAPNIHHLRHILRH
jgi:hypothetical protein